MSDVSKIYLSDKHALAMADQLLQAEGIRRDANLDYLCGIYDDDMQLIAVGGCFENTLRCFAVDSNHRGEALLNIIVTHLLEVQQERGNLHCFVYTKPSTCKLFESLGFYTVAAVPGELVFLENKRRGFASYLDHLSDESEQHQAAAGFAVNESAAVPAGAIIMNANPFTLGHRYLVEQAARECRVLHLFIISDDASLFPTGVRRQLVEAGTADLGNIIYHATGSYLISRATFPSYFQKDNTAVSRGHALLDTMLFERIAAHLGITDRYVGEEPFSQTTNLYNSVMLDELPRHGITPHVISRREIDGEAISASEVRHLLQSDDWSKLQSLVPQTTLDFLQSPAAAPIIERIKATADVTHH